MKGRNIPTLFR